MLCGEGPFYCDSVFWGIVTIGIAILQIMIFRNQNKLEKSIVNLEVEFKSMSGLIADLTVEKKK